MATHSVLTEHLKKLWLRQLQGNQEAISTNVLEWEGYICVDTYRWKVLCYQLPSLIMEGTAIVFFGCINEESGGICNAKFQLKEIGSLIYQFSLSKQALIRWLDVLSGKTKLLYVAPRSPIKRKKILNFWNNLKFHFMHMDEAHCDVGMVAFQAEYRHTSYNKRNRHYHWCVDGSSTPKVQLIFKKPWYAECQCFQIVL